MDGLSKTKYCRGVQCPKMLWMDKYMPEEAVQKDLSRIFQNGTEVGEYAKSYFGGYAEVAYDQDKAKMCQSTQKLLAAGEPVIAEASFAYNGLFCSVDILHITENGADIIEVKSSTTVNDIYYDDMAFQYYVLSACGIKVNKVYNMHINSSYVRKGQLDLKQLFTLEDCTEQILSKQDEVAGNITYYRSYLQQSEEPNQEIGMQCEEPYECCYKNYCHRGISSPSVFSIQRLAMKKKYELYHQGICSYADIMQQTPKLNANQWKQVKMEVNNEPADINVTEIKNFLSTVKYPLYHLDFETYQQPVPLYDGVKPYMQIPFQYSLHVEHAPGGELQHYEFLAKDGADPRRALAEALCRDIPKDVCVMAYNMSFEKMIIRNLAEQFQDLAGHLLSIHDNMVDLMVPFQKKYYYCKEMQGSYSIKYVLPALCKDDPELNYSLLQGLHNGDEAMTAFIQLHNCSEEEKETIRKQLLAYCRLDTLAMVKIMEKLYQIIR